MITTNEDLQSAILELAHESVVALDTEFYWRNTYYPKLCLIQIATCNKVYIIDVLADDIDLYLLNPLFANPKILKVMHAAENDIKILKHYLNCTFCGIFDTQMAMAFLGHDHQLSLTNTLNHLGFEHLNKHEKMSDWRHRPLSLSQIEYATADVISLIKCQKLLHNKLTQTPWMHAFHEEMLYIQNEEFNNANDAPHKFKHHFARLNSTAQHHLIQLAIWREQYAQHKDWIPRYMLSDKDLLSIVKLNPLDVQSLSDNQIISQRKIQRFGMNIIQVLQQSVNTVINIDVIDSARIKVNKTLLNLCFEEISKAAEKMQLPIALVVSKRELQYFLYKQLINPSYRNIGRLGLGWRFQYFGQAIYDYANNELKRFSDKDDKAKDYDK